MAQDQNFILPHEILTGLLYCHVIILPISKLHSKVSLVLMQVMNDLIDMGTVLNGIICNKLNLGRPAQLDPLTQLPAHITGRTVQPFDGRHSRIDTIQRADVYPAKG